METTKNILKEMDDVVVEYYSEHLWARREDGEEVEGLISGCKAEMKKRIQKHISPLEKIIRQQKKQIEKLKIYLYNSIVLLEEHTSLVLYHEIGITRKDYKEIMEV
jgi:flagellar biosynthesis chaperone FliJ